MNIKATRLEGYVCREWILFSVNGCEIGYLSFDIKLREGMDERLKICLGPILRSSIFNKVESSIVIAVLYAYIGSEKR